MQRRTMSNSRRQFLQSSAALAVGLMGSNTLAAAETSVAETPASPAPSGEKPLQVPKMRFGTVEVSRLVLGVNPLYGFVHYNKQLLVCGPRMVYTGARRRSPAPCGQLRYQRLQLR